MLAAIAVAILLGGHPAVASATGRWSTPATASCPASGAPSVLFPSRKPNLPTGPGALVWPGASSCPGGAGARVQAVAEGASPSTPAEPRTATGAALAPVGSIAAASAPQGEIAISGSDPRAPGRELLVQGAANGHFRAVIQNGALTPPGALSTAYLGDLALLGRLGGRSGGMAVRVERWFGGSVGPELRAGGAGAGPIGAATVAMDFRSDAIAAWARAGSLFVADLPAHGHPRAARRIGPAGRRTQIAALLSDDDRGMVMWSAATGATTSVWLDYSKPGPSFGTPQLLERYTNPHTSAQPPASVQLIRLSSESVMAAWAGVDDGRFVIRTAPIDQHGLLSVSTTAEPGVDALLGALAPGPDSDAILLFAEPRKEPSAAQALFGQPKLDEPLTGSLLAGALAAPPPTQTLLAARGSETSGHTSFAAAETIATIPLRSRPAVAFEPGTDRALAAWQGPGGTVQFSFRTSAGAG